MSRKKSLFQEHVRSRFLAYALYDSIQDKDLRSIQYLLTQKKANPNYVFGDLGVSPLHVAAGIGDEWFSSEVVRSCMACGGDPNIRNPDGITPVHVAAIWKRMEVLKILTKFGGDLFIIDDDGYSALDYITKANDLSNTSDSWSHSSTRIKNGMSIVSPSPHQTSVGLPICEPPRNDFNSSELDSYYDCLADDERWNLFNNAFIDDDECFHSCSSEFNTPLLSDVPSDLCYSEIHSLHIDKSFNKFHSPLVDQVYEPLKSVERDISVGYPSHLQYNSKNSSGMTLEFHLPEVNREINLNESRRISAIPRISLDTTTYYEALDILTETSCGSLSSCPTEKLKHRLKEHKILHGPLLKSTKRVYLYQLRKASNSLIERTSNHQPTEFNDVVISTLNQKITECVDKWSPLESLMIEQLEGLDKLRLKLDTSKQYFTYLLLDPIISKDIKKSTSRDCLNESWPIFLKSVFYIGKGKNSRPLDHLVDAVKTNKTSVSDKIKKIKKIWEKGFGIVCIHIFHNISEAEALTREACMISAMSIANLTNLQSGKCYGEIQKWSLKKRRQLGVVLLYRSLLLLIAEGERQIFPADLKKC